MRATCSAASLEPIFPWTHSHTLREGSLYALGQKASHGCIRLKVKDAKWIYDTCPEGTTVVIQE